MRRRRPRTRSSNRSWMKSWRRCDSYKPHKMQQQHRPPTFCLLRVLRRLMSHQRRFLDRQNPPQAPPHRRPVCPLPRHLSDLAPRRTTAWRAHGVPSIIKEDRRLHQQRQKKQQHSPTPWRLKTSSTSSPATRSEWLAYFGYSSRTVVQKMATFYGYGNRLLSDHPVTEDSPSEIRCDLSIVKHY